MPTETPNHWSQPLADFLLGSIRTGLPTMLLYTSAGFVIAIILMMWIARRKLLCRRPRLWNVLAKLSYLLILSGVLFTAATLGAVRHLQQYTMAVVDARLLPAVHEYSTVLVVTLTANIGTLISRDPQSIPMLVDATLQRLYYHPASTSMWERGKAGVVNWTIRTIGGDALTKVLEDARRDGSMRTLNRALPKLIVTATRDRLNDTFSSGYTMIAMAALLIAAIVAGEMLLYFRWYERRRTRT